MGYQIAANGLMLLHAGFIAFVVGGLLFTLIGGSRGWGWVRNLWFRLVHLAAIVAVVVQTWAKLPCPLTAWESQLREAAGQNGYPEGFIVYWVHQIIFYDLPHWSFTLIYTLFGVAVVVSFVLVPPRWRISSH
jgi:hypothetical protein